MGMNGQISIGQLREDLALALRLAAWFDFNEGICNHFSAVVPGDKEYYLINPYGYHWSQIQAEHLLMIDGDGQVIEGEGEVEATARFIHVAGHRANPRHGAILHTHMPHATALTMLEDGRLEMAHQTACRFFGRLAYQKNYGGLALDETEGDAIASIAREQPEADVFFLAHHGVTVAGPTVAHAFDDLYYLERACRQQILAQATGRPLRLLPDEAVRHTARQSAQTFDVSANGHFEALREIGV